MSGASDQIIGDLDAMQEGGKGLVFKVENNQGEVLPAFAVCFDARYFAYINRCGHIAIPLDYMPGEFFSDDGRTIMCSTHGAEYAPDTGACLGGPCFGVGLEPLAVSAADGKLYLSSDDFSLVKAVDKADHSS